MGGSSAGGRRGGLCWDVSSLSGPRLRPRSPPSTAFHPERGGGALHPGSSQEELEGRGGAPFTLQGLGKATWDVSSGVGAF